MTNFLYSAEIKSNLFLKHLKITFITTVAIAAYFVYAVAMITNTTSNINDDTKKLLLE